MNILKKLFKLEDDICIGLCKFTDEIEDLSLKESRIRAKNRYKKEITISQMLKRTT